MTRIACPSTFTPPSTSSTPTPRHYLPRPATPATTTTSSWCWPARFLFLIPNSSPKCSKPVMTFVLDLLKTGLHFRGADLTHRIVQITDFFSWFSPFQSIFWCGQLQKRCWKSSFRHCSPQSNFIPPSRLNPTLASRISQKSGPLGANNWLKSKRSGCFGLP